MFPIIAADDAMEKSVDPTDKLLTMKEATLCFPVSASHVVLAEMLRGPFKGHLNGYGGEIEPDESVVDATIRETREEAGIEIAAEDIEGAGVIDFFNFKNDEWRRVRVFVSLVRKWHGTPCAGDGMGAPQEYAHHELPFERMMPADRIWIPKILTHGPHRGEFWYQPGFTGLRTDKEALLYSLKKEELDRLWTR